VKQFLSEELNVRKMYQMYSERMAYQNEEAVSEKMYRKVFDQEYNLAFRSKKGVSPMMQFLTAVKK